MPQLAVAAAVLGVLAAVPQAAGLLRCVPVMRALAAAGSDEAVVAARHASGGAVLGVHLGQLLTAAHVAVVAWMQRAEGRRRIARPGGRASLAIAAGAFETVAIAPGHPGETLGLVAVAGYLGLSLRMVASGLGLPVGSVSGLGAPARGVTRLDAVRAGAAFPPAHLRSRSGHSALRPVHRTDRSGRLRARTAPHPFFRQRLPSTSAICTALSAAPLRRLSDTTHIDRPFSTVESCLRRLT
jgi:hypothetical protein